jgi:hypothetical protein
LELIRAIPNFRALAISCIIFMSVYHDLSIHDPIGVMAMAVETSMVVTHKSKSENSVYV